MPNVQASAGIAYYPTLGYAQRTHLRPAILVSAVVSLLALSLIRTGSLQLVTAQTSANTGATLFNTNYPNQQSGTSLGSIGGEKRETPNLKSCSPDSSYGPPTTLDLSNAQMGLTQVIDRPNVYQIYGYTAEDLRAQMSRCAPKSNGDEVAEFTAETSYQLNWQYTYEPNGHSQCVLGNIKVGIHINQVMPLWHPTRFAAPDLADKWSTFLANLTTHENGHTTLDVLYATIILHDLQNFPAFDCDNIVSAADYMVQSDIATLNQANDNYDAQTNHGATQGAILP